MLLLLAEIIGIIGAGVSLLSIILDLIAQPPSSRNKPQATGVIETPSGERVDFKMPVDDVERLVHHH